MLSATRLLLLQNPEHATALNERRRIILRSRSHGDDPVFRSRLAAEQRLVELLLEVPQHAKAWTLWHHLRWILSTLYPVDPSSVSSPTFAGAGVPSPSGAPALLPPLVAEAQFALALRCATIYPRNYYAWRHRLWLLAITTSTPSGNSASGSTADTLQEQYQTVSAFLRRNPRDHTAANYLAVVVKARSSIDPEASTPDAMALVNELIDRYPAVETPWLFARHLVSLEGPHAALSGLQGRSLRLLEAAQTGSKAQEGTLAGKEQDERSRAAVLGTRACLWAGMQVRAYLWPAQSEMDSQQTRTDASASCRFGDRRHQADPRRVCSTFIRAGEAIPTSAYHCMILCPEAEKACPLANAVRKLDRSLPLVHWQKVRRSPFAATAVSYCLPPPPSPTHLAH